MQQELNALVEPSSSPELSSRDIIREKLASIDIAQINAIGFYFNIQLLDNEVFLTMIYEIDLLLEEKEALATEDQETIDLIHIKLLTIY